jgi:hypothetical protein
LAQFTHDALKRREATRSNYLAAEYAANEEKLLHSRLIHTQDLIESNNGPLSAVFMPMPGTIPVKSKDMWSKQGILSPWGGRFRSPEKKSSLEVYIFLYKRFLF